MTKATLLALPRKGHRKLPRSLLQYPQNETRLARDTQTASSHILLVSLSSPGGHFLTPSRPRHNSLLHYLPSQFRDLHKHDDSFPPLHVLVSPAPLSMLCSSSLRDLCFFSIHFVFYTTSTNGMPRGAL
ncbi:hypothetical protein BS17DRAFT_319762 [Gyrodon lividus]|nr:hypothetical protein BS17DRAFT_319762 [Gyrodon lividus]